MVKWVQEAIHDHYVIAMEPIDEDLFPPINSTKFQSIEIQKNEGVQQSFLC
jgi:hypothetical protein